MHQPALLTAITAALAALPSAQAGLYTRSSPVLQVDARSYQRLVADSNYTTILEFYAPWCGHCQNLKPAFEKAAKKLDGYAKVAAIDCDEEENKQFCGGMGVQGFPTLKTVRPAKKAGGKPIIEDYNGPRTATGIVEDVLNKVNNHVTRVADKDLDSFLEGDKPKAVLFSDKGVTSALLRSIAIAYLDVINVGQIRNKETAAVEKFGITKFPTFMLIPGPGKEPVIYEGELNKKDMVEFLKQVAEPNPDPAPAKKKSKAKKKDEPKQAPPEPEEAPESSTVEETPATATPSVIPIASIMDDAMLAKECLQKSSHTCILAFVPAGETETGTKAVDSLSQLSTKYIHGKRHTFPFFALPSDIPGAGTLRTSLELKDEVEIIALNARRGWWRQYSGDLSAGSVESWIDAIRMGDGEKKKLPSGVVHEEAPEPAADEPESETVEAVHGTGTTAEEETEAPEVVVEKLEDEVNEEKHDEL
ncbi:thioredoxin domain-containing protein [Sarocladium implicatum]|nr:thioredoxin domain-containing protein [Sarocladium implicatum]